MAEPASIAAVYLARHADGLEPLSRFVASYRRHDAGIDHTLVVILKGHLEARTLAAAREKFAGTPHVALELDDSGFDVGSYAEAVRRLPYTHLCFLSTSTEIATPGWLAMLAKRATRDGVGIVGAMGSYESLYDTNRLITKLSWLRDAGAVDARIAAYYQEFLESAEAACHDAPLPPSAPDPRAASALWRDLRFRLHLWRELRWRGNHADWAGFPRFPNPHVRTTGFMIRRDVLLGFERAAIRHKQDAYEVESGAAGLTARVRRGGAAALIVTRDDREFEVGRWADSETFGRGDQRGLLVTDKHSRRIATMAPAPRLTRARLAWGDDLAGLPRDYPRLGLAFARGSLAPP